MMFFNKKKGKNDKQFKRPFRILFLADEEDPHYARLSDGTDRMKDIDLVVACGDLSHSYMHFLTMQAHCDTIYVNGNHHGAAEIPGWLCIDDKVVEYQGIRILGLGGSMNYNNGPFQYTEKAMASRVKKLKRELNKGFDILVTHAPAFGINDAKAETDRCHIGFRVFNELLDNYKPKYFVHGHIHSTYGTFKRVTEYNDTTIINAYKSYIIEITPDNSRLYYAYTPPREMKSQNP